MKKQKTAEKPTKQAEKRNLIEGQKCVMLGVVVNTDNTKAFEKWFKKELGMRIEYVTQYETLRDTDNGYDVEGTGGRSDVIFYLHKEDIMKMVTRRFGIDVKWWEDMVDNNSDIIPEEILNTNLKYS